MAYGSPASPDDIEAYYTDIRRGRPPTSEQLADLVRRYDAIGGLSPLAQRTEEQRAAVERHLEALDPGRYQVVLGLKHSEPKIEAAVEQLAAEGVDRVVGLVLAPHYSAMSVGEYLKRLRAEASRHDLDVVGIESWATEAAYVDFLSGQLSTRLPTMPERTIVVFTAHSLPKRIVDDGDPYPDELLATAAAVSRAAGLERESSWVTAWQSAGRTPEPWLGPDIVELVHQLGGTAEIDGVLVCACGFVADHLEVLYDLDIDARTHAESVGLVFDRTASVNDDASVMAALAERVHAAATAPSVS